MIRRLLRPGTALRPHRVVGEMLSRQLRAAADDAAAAVAPPRDIEELIVEAHARAVSEGKMQYTDPKSGFDCFTQLAAEQRGHCCGSGCRHCPYEHDKVPESRRARLPKPILVSNRGAVESEQKET